MKKLLTAIFSAGCILLGTSAYAEFIETQSHEEFTSRLVEYTKTDYSKPFSMLSVSEDALTTNRLIVISKNDFDYSGAQDVLYNGNGLYILVYPSVEKADIAYKKLLDDKTIQSVTPDDELTIEPISVSEGEPDSSGHLSWGPEFTGADGFNRYIRNHYAASGEPLPEIRIAVIDTGIDPTAPIFNGRVDIDAGKNYINEDELPIDDNNHGTHVAGIICDSSLPNVKLIPYKTMAANGKGSLSLTMAAVLQAQKDNVDIINLSIGGKDSSYSYRRKYSSIFDNSEESTASSDIIYVTSAGNYADDVRYYFPANVSSVIAVSACDKNGEFAGDYSNYGTLVDICAPGTDINSTIADGAYEKRSGTSMACPFVSAAVAMAKTLYPTASAVTIQEMIASAALDAGEPGHDPYYGWGILNFDNLYENNDIVKEVSYTDGQVSLRVNAADGALSSGTYAYAAGFKNGLCAGLTKRTVSPVIADDFNITIDFADNNYDSIRVFLWDYNMKPITEYIELK